MKLGRYEILEELGKGGFGIVYKAEDEVLGRTVALKVLHPTLLVDPGFISRFRNEACLAAQLDHPNLVPVYDFSEIDGRYLITMAHMAGGSLKDLLAVEGAQSSERALQILEDICQGLDYAHIKGIVHRDLKPSNILFDDKAVARISDMGFAKIVGGGSVASLTTSGQQVGTPSYMAPEIWKGQPATVASDLYSLACITIELFTGKPFFDGETTPEIMLKHFQPREIPVEIPLELRPALEKALAEKPEQRFGSISEFLAAIKQGGDKAAGSDQFFVSSQPSDEKQRSPEPTLPKPAPGVGGASAVVGVPGKTESKKKWFPIAIIGTLLVVLGVLAVSLIKTKSKLAALPTQSESTLPSVTESPEPKEEVLVVLAVEEPTEIKQPEPTQTLTPALEIGSTMTRKADGMVMVYVSAGEFTMGNEAGKENQKPERPVKLDAYWIDKYEVSNAQYARCVEAGACTMPSQTNSETRDNYFDNEDFANYPVIFVSWHQAQAYCQWAGGSLPTEAQWEKAARGNDKRTYPWKEDNRPNCQLANFQYDQDKFCVGDTSPVTDYELGASPYGALNMAGNVWEWVLDWYGSYDSAETDDPKGPDTDPGNRKVIRGGSWLRHYLANQTSYRSYNNPTSNSNDYGFRCAMPINIEQTGTIEGPFELSNTKMTPGPPLETVSTMIRETDGMEMVYVSAGEFTMGSEFINDNAKPIRQVYLDAYWIDKYEVSNAQYALCVNTSPCTKPSLTLTNTRSNYYGNQDFDNYPVVNVDWYQAQAHCEWTEGNLPTEAQWEKAARGSDGKFRVLRGDSRAGTLWVLM